MVGILLESIWTVVVNASLFWIVFRIILSRLRAFTQWKVTLRALTFECLRDIGGDEILQTTPPIDTSLIRGDINT